MERVEKITDKQGIFLISLFLMGSTLIMGTGSGAKNDAWVAVLLGMVFALPLFLVFSRLLAIMPDKNLFEIMDFAFGKIIGKLAGILYIWYFFHLGSLVIRNFGEFIDIVALPETPILVSMLVIGLCSLASARAGIEVMGRMSTILFPSLIVIIFIVQLLGIPILQFDNILPVLGQGLLPVVGSAFSVFSFPFAEAVVLLAVLNSVKSKKTTCKVFFYGLLISGFFIALLTMRNIMVLGDLLGKMHFPSYQAVSRIKMGDFLQRLEVTVSFAFVVASFTKISLCVFAASKGIEVLFKLVSYRNIVIQVGLLMVLFSYIIYESVMEMRMWAFDVYPYYAFPFQVILPLITWITVEIKVRKAKAKEEDAAETG